MGWYPIRIRNKMHRHETESQGNFEGFLDNYQSIPDVVMAQQSVQISFWRLLTLLCSLFKHFHLTRLIKCYNSTFLSP